MSYDEPKDFCRKTWEENYKYFCIDRRQERYKGRFCTYFEAIGHIQNAFPR